MNLADRAKGLAAVVEALRSIPFEPRPLGGRTSTILGFAPDLLPMQLDSRKKTASRLYPYPRDFAPVDFRSLDGTPLAARMALHKDGRPRPGLVLSHGIFGSKNQHYVRSVAVKAFRDWGYNVLALDLRSFGESQRLSDAMMSGGWKESDDIRAAVRLLASFPAVTSVGVFGYSMGGTSALIASGTDGGEYITGGVLAWSAASDLFVLTGFTDQVPMPWDPFFLMYPSFRYYMSVKIRSRGAAAKGIKGFRGYFAHTFEDYYGVPEAEGFALASPANYVGQIKIPTLHIHAQDDPVIPVSEAEGNLRAAGNNPDFEVWIVKRGGHCAFRVVDKRWFEQVTQDFFGAWALRE